MRERRIGYRYTKLLERIEGTRAYVIKGNVRPLAWLTRSMGVNLGIARPGSFQLSQLVFLRNS